MRITPFDPITGNDCYLHYLHSILLEQYETFEYLKSTTQYANSLFVGIYSFRYNVEHVIGELLEECLYHETSLTVKELNREYTEYISTIDYGEYSVLSYHQWLIEYKLWLIAVNQPNPRLEELRLDIIRTFNSAYASLYRTL